jgi:hypothetical protein
VVSIKKEAFDYSKSGRYQRQWVARGQAKIERDVVWCRDDEKQLLDDASWLSQHEP